jgi:predicted DNA-binding protein YlxM (UPF0122 family)
MKVIDWWKSLTEETRKEYMREYLSDDVNIDNIHSIFGMDAEDIANIYIMKTGIKL